MNFDVSTVTAALRSLAHEPFHNSSRLLLAALESGGAEVGAPSQGVLSSELRATYAVRAQQARRAGHDDKECLYLANVFANPVPFLVYVVSVSGATASGGLFVGADGRPIGCVAAPNVAAALPSQSVAPDGPPSVGSDDDEDPSDNNTP